MSNPPNLPSVIQSFGDMSAQIDAYGRARVSNPHTLFDSKQVFENSELYFDDLEIDLGTLSTYDVNRSSTRLTVSDSVAGARIRQTFQSWDYQPGKGQLAHFTFLMGENVEGVKKRVGLFNSENGLFFEMDGTKAYFVVRSNVSGSVVDTRILQTQWNVNGLGDQDWEKAQVFWLDFEWHGTGSVRFGFILDGLPVLCHTQHYANFADSVYMGTPNLPIHYSIVNDGSGGASSMEHLCCSVITEGGSNPPGTVLSAGRDVLSPFVTGNQSLYPLFSMRINPDFIGAAIELLICTITETLGGPSYFRYQVLMNPVIAGVDAVNWVSLSNSAIQYDVSRDVTNIISGGTIITSGTAGGGKSTYPRIPESSLRLGASILGVPDEIVIAVQNISPGNQNYFADMTWSERY